FNDYLKACGSTARIINGYGLSELGGACVLAPSDREDDAIGFLLPGFNAKIYVEDEKKYYDIADGPRTGLLLLNSPTMSTGKLGDTVFFKLENVDGADYFNTNDLVRINDDGSLTCIGRSNQFFVNNAGVRFDAGLVQTAITSQPGVRACGLAPEFHKTLHDNIPVLYV
ncbi:MAG: AMP-binding protein, partial [Lachnospiraceae bacterium]|nr:AMP-binding protein [Lachnospiraceae bacterium]